MVAHLLVRDEQQDLVKGAPGALAPVLPQEDIERLRSLHCHLVAKRNNLTP